MHAGFSFYCLRLLTELKHVIALTKPHAASLRLLAICAMRCTGLGFSGVILLALLVRSTNTDTEDWYDAACNTVELHCSGTAP